VNINFYKGSSLINVATIEQYIHVYVCMYMERIHSKMHVMVMHSNDIVVVKHSEYRLKHMIETHSWDQEAATKTIG
jgi:hypothetical protein